MNKAITTTPVVPLVPLQPASLDIWDSKYRLKTGDGQVVDQDIDATYRRIANALAAQESPDIRDRWENEFLWALQHGAIPAGRILSNAGAEAHKPKVSTINCTVSCTIEDSMEAILESAKLAGITLKSGAGIGYEFSTLRPEGALVAGAGASTSGPLSFMAIFDKVCATVSSAGGRRGAQMATFDVAHPDVAAFIQAKRADGVLRQFNLSLLITEDFLSAVREDGPWNLVFPVLPSEREGLDLQDPSKVIWREWPNHDAGYTISGDGLVACRIYRTVRARELWDMIMQSTYDFAEPGFILIDRVNKLNNNWWCENIRATNPCGEQPLPPHGSCLLGSVNLTAFVKDPFTAQASFDWETYSKVVRVFTRMLDNVVEINGLPLTDQREEIHGKRRHGMGFLGLGSTLTLLRMRYDSQEARAFAAEVSKVMALEGWRVALELSKEKGPAPVLESFSHVSLEMLRQKPQLAQDGYKAGDIILNAELHARYSDYMARIRELDPDLVDELAKVGARFTHHTSIAPTGTIALSLANNASNGIEPSFAHHYSRNVIREGRKTKEKVSVFSYELLAYRTHVNPEAMPDDPMNPLPDYFIAADSISPKAHIDMQAACQPYIDSAISKTINVATDCPYEDFKALYLYAAEQGLKGCTTFRFNPAAFQGVLVKESDLAATTYRFVLEDDSVIECKGNDTIEYDGAQHSAANLFDALKEGRYQHAA